MMDMMLAPVAVVATLIPATEQMDVSIKVMKMVAPSE